MGDQGNFGAGQGNPLRPAMLIVGPAGFLFRYHTAVRSTVTVVYVA